MSADRIWKPLVAGLCGSAAHSGLMFLKNRMGLLASFQPYEDLQRALSQLTGSSVHPLIPWKLQRRGAMEAAGVRIARDGQRNRRHRPHLRP